MGVIVGGVVGVLLLVSAFGVAAAVIKGGSHPTPTPALPSFKPAPATPAATPNPQPTATPTASPSGNVQTIDVQNITVAAPTSWTVADQKSNTIVLVDPGKGVIEFFSDKMQPAETVAQLLQDDLVLSQKTNPNAKICSGPKAEAIPGGPNGMGEGICYTETPQGGASFPAETIWLEGVSADGSTEFAIEFVSSVAQLPAFLNDASTVQVRWKLPQ